MEAPAEPLELFLAEPVAVAGALGGVVGGAVAFDREDVAAGLVGVLDGEVDPVAGGPVLGGRGSARCLRERVADVDLERVQRGLVEDLVAEVRRRPIRRTGGTGGAA